MADNRHVHIKCVRRTDAAEGLRSWCGRSLAPDEWAFEGIDHAYAATVTADRLLPCVECGEAILRTLAVLRHLDGRKHA